MGADGHYLVNHEVPTLTPEHIEIDDVDHPPNTPKGTHEFVALITNSLPVSYSRHYDLEWTIDSEASISMTPFRGMLRGFKPCSDGDFVSVADKEKLQIKE